MKPWQGFISHTVGSNRDFSKNVKEASRVFSRLSDEEKKKFGKPIPLRELQSRAVKRLKLTLEECESAQIRVCGCASASTIKDVIVLETSREQGLVAESGIVDCLIARTRSNSSKSKFTVSELRQLIPPILSEKYRKGGGIGKFSYASVGAGGAWVGWPVGAPREKPLNAMSKDELMSLWISKENLAFVANKGERKRCRRPHVAETVDIASSTDAVADPEVHVILD
uniref:Plus3 domain-containing protein n=1 Tax=Macrostomum lignano TaxID=282301 RepID=A0A1I8GVQ9_9PLAT